MTKPEIKIIKELPPVWDKVIAAGMNPNPETVIFAYGDTIYNPGDILIPDYIMEHEEMHLRQQGYTEAGAIEWWDRYLVDPHFCIREEAEAYAAQYDFMCRTTKDRNQRFNIMRQLAHMLSGEMYGSVVSVDFALTAIREKAHTKR